VDLPLNFWDGPHHKVFVIMLPKDAETVHEQGILRFREGSKTSLPSVTSASSKDPHQASGGEKTIEEWKESQHLFKDLPKLPDGWLYIKSRSKGNVYYWDVRNQKPSYERPLPPGWTKEKSKTSGKVYYFNAKKRKSVYEFPTDES